VDNPAFLIEHVRTNGAFVSLAFVRNAVLRTAITRNLVSFPSQIRPFAKRTAADLQVRIVQLYFIRGWSVRRICDRYHLRKEAVHQLIAQWRIRAIESGSIQEIEPGVLAAIVPEAQDIADTDYLPRPFVPAFSEAPTRHKARLTRAVRA
jgi:transposase-like protein